MKYIAQTFSFLLHPFVLPLYVLFVIFNISSVFSFIPLTVRLYCYLITLVTVVLLPLLSVFVFKKLKLISSYSLEDKPERVYPITVAILFGFLGLYLLGKMPYTNIIRQFFLLLIIVLSAFSTISIRWKMSMHMTAIGAVCGFLIIFGLRYTVHVRTIFVVMLLLAGILATCRLYLEKHNPAQVYAGFLFGLMLVAGILLL